MAHFFQFLFWISIGGLFYTFAGYPLMMALLVKLAGKGRVAGRDAAGVPSVSVVLVVHNEAARIAKRIENLLESDYPQECLEILVVSDGSSDGTTEIVAGYSDRHVRLFDCNPRVGKASCLNRAAKAISGEIVVFADARQRFDSNAISRLVSWFGNPRIGAVSGNLSIESSGSSVGKGVDAYWRLERTLRYLEARFDSSIGCTGAIYAVRGRLFEGLPEDTLLDDVVIPMLVALKGYRVVFDREACAYDPQALEPKNERIRKRRTLAGNLQMLFRYPGWLLPWRNRLWWQLISHKYLRLTSPVLLLALFWCNLILARETPYNWFLGGQIVFFTLGLWGLVLPGRKRAWLSIPSGFLFLNWMVVTASIHFAFGPRKGWWGPASAAEKGSLATR